MGLICYSIIVMGYLFLEWVVLQLQLGIIINKIFIFILLFIIIIFYFFMYGIDQEQYHATTEAITQYDLAYKNLFISTILALNATHLKLREFPEKEISFGHHDVIPDDPINIVVMIIKQDQKHKQLLKITGQEDKNKK